jgi:hypothetical protein
LPTAVVKIKSSYMLREASMTADRNLLAVWSNGPVSGYAQIERTSEGALAMLACNSRMRNPIAVCRRVLRQRMEPYSVSRPIRRKSDMDYPGMGTYPADTGRRHEE